MCVGGAKWPSGAAGIDCLGGTKRARNGGNAAPIGDGGNGGNDGIGRCRAPQEPAAPVGCCFGLNGMNGLS